MNSKFGMFSVLVLGVMMLLIPATSIANAQEYNDRYYEDEQYEKIDKKSYMEQYKKKDDERKSYYNDGKEKNEEPVIIIKNEPIQEKEKKKIKEPSMLLVKKDVLYCDVIADGSFSGFCNEDGSIEGPESNRYVQICNDDNPICNDFNEVAFDMIVTDDIEFPGSEEGTKLNLNGERFTVTEDSNIGFIEQDELVNSQCLEAGFNGGFNVEFLGGSLISICKLNVGECSGIIPDGEIKECTVKNYIVFLGV